MSVQTARRLVVVESQSSRFLPRRRRAACDMSVGGRRGPLAPCPRDARLKSLALRSPSE